MMVQRRIRKEKPPRSAIMRRCREYLIGVTGRKPGTGKNEFIQEVADQAVAGVIPFHFFTPKQTSVGRTQIDWSGKHHAHQEWPAQLNRFFQLAHLAGAYQKTKDARYAEAARDYLADWLRAHPPRAGWKIAPYDNTLNLAIRQQMWWTRAPLLFEEAVFDDDLIDRMAASTAAQLDYLLHNLTAFGNWRIAQAEAILRCGIILAHRQESAHWRQVGVSLLNDAFHRQVLPDGAHIERNTGYHSWMTQVFEQYWRLSRRMPELGLAITAEAVARMHDYAIAGTRPNGSPCGLHDTTGVDTGPRNPLWGKTRKSFRREAGLPFAMPPTSQYFPDAGQAFLRDSWNEDAVYITFDATQWGGGHCHLSRNAIQLCAFGRSLLVDPGILNYDARDPMMFYGRSTRGHNTLNANGWNQATTNPSPLQWASVPGYDCVMSRYGGGYWPGRYQWWFDHGLGRGIWAEHHRILLWIHDRAIVVFDQFRRSHEPKQPTLESNWQLAPGKVAVDVKHRCAVTQHNDANVLMLFPIQDKGTKISVHEGEKKPLRGWLANRKAAPQVSLVSPMESWVVDLATVLIPFRGVRRPTVTATGKGPGWNGVGELVLAWKDGSRDRVYWTACADRMIGQTEDIRSDAGLIHVQSDKKGRTVRAFAWNATYLEPLSAKRRAHPESFAIRPRI